MRGRTFATLDPQETGTTILALRMAINELEPFVRGMTSDAQPEWETTLQQMKVLSARLDNCLRSAAAGKLFEKVKANAR